MEPMIAYHNNPTEKAAILRQLVQHAEADQIVKGIYWQDGKGCAVGCTIRSGRHVEYEARFGIPEALARLEDRLFEGLPNGRAQVWPLEFMSAVAPGADLTRVVWRFLHWLLTDVTVNPGIHHALVRDAVAQCARIVEEHALGHSVPESAASAESAARSAGSAASAESAASAGSAAKSAAAAAWSAASAAESAWSARSAARSAAWSAAE